jgi:hypothetical protein
VTEPEAPQKAKPLYWRLLRLRHVRPNSWQRAVFFEGSIAVGAVLVLADLASAWLLIVLPVAVAVVVKAHDVLVGWLRPGTLVAGEPVEAAPDAYASVLTVQLEDAAEQQTALEPEPEPDAETEPEPNVRVITAPKPRPARSRPGAAAARAQVSAAQSVRRRRAAPAPTDGDRTS